jgi:predicted MFS family arabinose efflux permease
MGRDYGWMLMFMTLWSVGQHVYMPIEASLAIHMSRPGQQGRRLGQVSASFVAATVVGASIVWVGERYLHARYGTTFLIGGSAAMAAALLLTRLRQPGTMHARRDKLVVRRRYSLYYLLCVLFGARKQVFITFGPWVLIKVFNQHAYNIAQLWIVAALIGIFFRPQLGKAIDRFGERVVLRVDAVILLLVCLGYGFARGLGIGHWALRLTYVCFVTDQVMFCATMAHNTYLHKIALSPRDITPSLSLGVSINHAVSMSVPTLGGLLWVTYGYRWVFVAAAGVAVLMFAAASQIRVRIGGDGPPSPLESELTM